MLLFPATGWDLKEGRIPNALIFLGLSAGAAFRIFAGGAQGPGEFLFSIIWPFILLYPLFFIRVLGAGDIKVFCMVSPFLSPREESGLILFSFVLGAGFSCYRIIRHRELLIRLSLFSHYIQRCTSNKKILRYSTLDNKNSYIRFSVFILVAFLLLVFCNL